MFVSPISSAVCVSLLSGQQPDHDLAGLVGDLLPEQLFEGVHRDRESAEGLHWFLQLPAYPTYLTEKWGFTHQMQTEHFCLFRVGFFF